MLVLTRKYGERLYVIDKETGAPIEILLCRGSDASARIGIEASARFEIVRDEIISDEQRADIRGHLEANRHEAVLAD